MRSRRWLLKPLKKYYLDKKYFGQVPEVFFMILPAFRLFSLIGDEFVAFNRVVVEVHSVETNGVFAVHGDAGFKPESLLAVGEHILT